MSADAGLAGKVGRGLGWSTAGNLVIRFGNLLISIVMARLIAPEQFGVFAVAMTIWTVLSSLAEFGLGADLIRSKHIAHKIPTVATMGVVIGGLLALAMALSAAPLARAFDSPESEGVIRLMSLSLLIVGLAVVPAALLQREFRQAMVFAVNGTAVVVSAVVMASLALAGFGPAALAWGQLAAQTFTLVAQYWATKTRPRFGFDRAIAVETASFCLPLALANVLSWFLLGVDNLIVSRVMTPVDLGLYVLAFNVSSWPMSAVGSAVRVVALPAFAKVETPAQRNRALVDVSGPVWTAGLFMGFMLGTLAVPVISVLYGERWIGAAAALVGLAAFGGLRVTLDLMATFLIAVGASRAVLAVQVWWLIVLVPSMLFAVHWFGLVGAGWAHLVVGLFAVVPAYLICLRRQGVQWTRLLRSWLFPTMVAAPAALATWWIATTLKPPIVALLAGGVVGTALYALPMARRTVAALKSLRDQVEIPTQVVVASSPEGLT